MKKNVLGNVFLILLPAMSVLLAAATDSVTVFDTVTGEVSAYSYFSMVPVANLQMCTPLAAMIAVAATALAVGFVVAGKHWCVKGLFWTAFASTVFATIPIITRGDVLVIPHVGLPLMMFIDCIIAYAMMKKPQEQTGKKKAPRLNGK